MRGDRHDREIHDWHASKIATADLMLQKIRAEMIARAELRENSNV